MRGLHVGRVVYAYIRGPHKNLSNSSLAARGGGVFLFVPRLLSLPDSTLSSS